MKYDTIRANFIRHIALKKLEQKEILSALEMTMIAFPCDENLTEQQKKELDSWHLSWKPQKVLRKWKLWFSHQCHNQIFDAL